MSRSPSAPEDAQSERPSAGKGHATPTRSEQEAARRRPLVANTKEARARAKAELNERREKARVGMANGEERYLPERDKGPQRRFVRDYVDSRWHLAEFVMPAMVLVIVLSLTNVPELQLYSMMILWVYILLAIAGAVIMSLRVKRAVRRTFGEDKLQRGTGWYATMRSTQMRFMRLPKAQVSRGTRVG